MTEIQQYSVVSRADGYEVRDYAACTVVDVAVTGTSFQQAGSAGFRPLLRYISGGNTTGSRFAMTAPVIQQAAQDTHIVTFVLPAGVRDVPESDDKRVSVRHLDRQLVAVRRYSGSTGAERYERELAALRACLKRDGEVETGPARLARYDPPWIPWFMRRNEAQIPIAAG